MKILIDDMELQGTPLELLEELRATAFGAENMSIEEYFDFMCKNYYQMTGNRIEFNNTNLEENCMILFKALSKIGVLEILQN